MASSIPCKYAEKCIRFSCTFTHPPGHPEDCKHAEKCVKFGCKFLHPAERPHDCNYGDKCHRDDCKFLHPKHHGQAAGQHEHHPHQQKQQHHHHGSPKGGHIKAAADGDVSVTKEGSSVKVKTTTGGKTEEVVITKMRREPLAFNVSVDASGSMAGALTDQAISSLQTIFDTVIEPTDLYGCQTFNSEVKNLHHCTPKSKINFNTDAKNIRANNGGCTALYDAIAAGINELKSVIEHQKDAGFQRPVPIQLVITDGADTSSKMKLDEVVELVAKHRKWRGYHLFIVAVGVDAQEAKIMHQICAPDHATFLRAKDCAEMKAMLGVVADRIKIAVQTTTADSTMKVEFTTTNADKAAKMLQGLAVGSKGLLGAGMRKALEGSSSQQHSKKK